MSEPEIDCLEQLQLSLELSDGCLDMIRELLTATLGEDHMKDVTPMFYPEAIQKAWVKKTLVLRHRLKHLREGAQKGLGMLQDLLSTQDQGLGVKEVLESLQTLLEESEQGEGPS